MRSIRQFFLLFLFTLPCFSQEVKLNVFRGQGEGISWSPDGKRIAYDMKGSTPEHYYELHTADTDGSHDTCISALCKALPHRHTGSPAWHSSGKYIMFVAEKPVHERSSVDAIPGFGAFTDIWMMTPNGKQAWKMYETPNDYDHGIIMPNFSKDGKHVVWVARKEHPHIMKKGNFLGLWQIMTADFVEKDGVPSFSNLKTYEPGGDGFYETYGFSPDGKKIIFCSNMDVRFWWNCQIYTMDASTGKDIQRLTSIDYNEHASFTPDGSHIVWMTNTMSSGGTDWWIMKADGSEKQRLSYFNEPTFPDYAGKKVWAGLVFFEPSGKRMMGGVQTSLTKQVGIIYTMDFLSCGKGNGLKGEYFSKENFTGTSKFRNDASVNIHWGPPWPDTLITSDSYSVRWTGQLEPLYSENYTFYTNSDKLLSVWLDDKLIIGSKTKANSQKEKTYSISLSAGQHYQLRVEYHNKKSVKASIWLAWSSPSQYKQVIPASQLYHN